MSVIRRNLIANFAGQGWIALMGFIFVPFYLRFIGAEGYGLVGIFVLLSSTLSLLDMGFGATATRQITAFNQADDEGKSQTIKLLRSIEGLFWGIAIFAGIFIALGAPLIATYWLKVETRRIPEIVAGIRLMAGALLVQFPIDFYSGCLIGIQQQVKLNMVNSISAGLRGLGAVLILWLISPTVQSFFAWQCILSFITVFWLRRSLWHSIDRGKRASWFDFAALRNIGRFTAGVGGINVLGYMLTQVDKIILSKILPLRVFGYYTLAWTLGTFASRFIGPVFNAYYPRIAQLVSQRDPKQLMDPHQKSELVEIYLKASRVMAIAVVPFSVWLAFFGREVLALWTHDRQIADAAAGALALIALGTMCNGFMNIPYGLQLASGWLGLAFWQNVVAVLLLVPLTYFFATRYGITGAAFPWLILNVGYVIIAAPLMYRLMLKGTKWNWYRSSVVYPFVQASCVTGFFYFLAIQTSGKAKISALMCVSLFVSVVAGVWSSGLIKIRELIRYRRVNV